MKQQVTTGLCTLSIGHAYFLLLQGAADDSCYFCDFYQIMTALEYSQIVATIFWYNKDVGIMSLVQSLFLLS